MLFGLEDPEQMPTWLIVLSTIMGSAGIGGVIGYVTAAYLKIQKQTDAEKARRNKTTVGEYQDLIDQKERQRQQDKAAYEERIEILEGNNSDVESRLWEMFRLYNIEYGGRVMLWDQLAFAKTTIEKINASIVAGKPITLDPPDLPPRPQTENKEQVDFMKAQTKQEKNDLQTVKEQTGRKLTDHGVTS